MIRPLWAVAGVAVLGTAGAVGALIASPGGDEEVVQQGLARLPFAHDHGLGRSYQVVVQCWNSRPSNRLFVGSKAEHSSQPIRFVFCHFRFAFVSVFGLVSVCGLNLYYRKTTISVCSDEQ